MGKRFRYQNILTDIQEHEWAGPNQPQIILTSTKTSTEIEKVAVEILGEHLKVIGKSSPFKNEPELYFLRMRSNLKTRGVLHILDALPKNSSTVICTNNQSELSNLLKFKGFEVETVRHQSHSLFVKWDRINDFCNTSGSKVLLVDQLTARDLKLPSVDQLIIFDMPAVSVFEDFVSIANAKRIFTFFESRDLETSPALVQFLKFNNQKVRNSRQPTRSRILAAAKNFKNFRSITHLFRIEILFIKREKTKSPKGLLRLLN